MSTRRPRSFTRDFKLSALKRMAETESVQGLAEELGIDRGQLYRWRAKARRGCGARADRARWSGRSRRWGWLRREWPRRQHSRAQRRIAELERKIGEQQVALDFFRAALRHVKARRPSTGAPGGTGSTA